MTALIFRIDPQCLEAGTSISLADREFAEELVLDRKGEKVAFGSSQVPGLWNVVAIGRLADYARDKGMIRIFFSDVVVLDHPVPVVTEGDPQTDDAMVAYAIDTMFESDMERVFGAPERYAQNLAPPLMAIAESAGFAVSGGTAYGAPWMEQQHSGFFSKVAAAYAWRCAFTGMSQVSLDGLSREGMVLGLEAPFRVEGSEVSRGVFVSASVAFCYRHGLLAIGDDYEILRRPELCAHMRMILEVVNRTAMINLPSNPRSWPDLEAARRHRHSFGY